MTRTLLLLLRYAVVMVLQYDIVLLVLFQGPLRPLTVTKSCCLMYQQGCWH